jgi:hypothetical protein
LQPAEPKILISCPLKPLRPTGNLFNHLVLQAAANDNSTYNSTKLLIRRVESNFDFRSRLGLTDRGGDQMPSDPEAALTIIESIITLFRTTRGSTITEGIISFFKTNKGVKGSLFVKSFTFTPKVLHPFHVRPRPIFTPQQLALRQMKNAGNRGILKPFVITTYQGEEFLLTDKSLSHLTTKHGHKFGINDPDTSPIRPNKNRGDYKSQLIRTKNTKVNKNIVFEEIRSIMEDPQTKVSKSIKIRGIKGTVFHCEKTDIVVGVHKKKEFKNQTKKAQSISLKQLSRLKEFKILP